MFKGLTIAAGVLAALYSGYWVAASTAVEAGARRLIEGLRDEGWQVSYDDLATRGFPSRVDTTVTALSLTDPATGSGWQAPMFQVLALAYAPNRVIAVWPERQVIALPGERLTVTARGLRASATVGVSTDLPLDQATAETGAFEIAADRGWTVSADRGLAAFRAAGPGPADYDLFAEAAAVEPPAALVATIDPQGQLPRALDLIRLDAAVTLDRPLDRHLAGSAALTALTLREARLTWGSVEITATGSLTVDEGGTPEGRIDIAIRDWRQVVAMAGATGLIDADAVPTWTRAAEALAEGGAVLQAPLGFQNGFMSLGPLPLGPAPRLRGY